MALKLKLSDTDFGISAQAAYAKVTMFTFNAVMGWVEAQVAIYANAKARTDGKSPISVRNYRGVVGQDGLPDLDSDIKGVRAAIYTWLKTLPDFVDASDV
jgi:hypothetical protein